MGTQTRRRGLAPVLQLDPERATFDAMLNGWTRAQLSRGLSDGTIAKNVWMARRFMEFVGDYPWRWKPSDVEDFTASVLSQINVPKHSTIRGYHQAIKLFCAFVTNPSYDWAGICEERFGELPIQICHDWNTHLHVAEFEGGSRAASFHL